MDDDVLRLRSVLRRRRRCPGDAKLEAVVQAVDLARGVTSESP